MSPLHNEYTQRMIDGEPIIRIGALWYGAETGTVVTNIYYFGNKNIQSILPIRAESAISFSTSSPPVDTLQVELVVNYSRFRSHLQRLMAQIQISPTLPIQNPVVAALTQPVQTNQEVYLAYGFMKVNDENVRNSSNRAELMRMYSSTPVHMKIDNVSIETISGSPRDIRVIFRVTRIATTNVYGDRVMYLRTMEDAIKQHTYMNKLLTEGGDDAQVDAMATMMGINAPGIRGMIAEMLNPMASGEDLGTIVDATITDVIAPDIYSAVDSGGRSLIVMPYGIECLNSASKLAYFGLSSEEDRAGLSGREGDYIKETTEFVKHCFGIDNTYDAEDCGFSATSVFMQGSNHVTLYVVDKGPIFKLDNDNQHADDATIHYCLIDSAESPVHGDLGNALISTGHAFHATGMYDGKRVPPEYNPSREDAKTQALQMAKLQIAGTTYSNYISPQALVQQGKMLLPWKMREQLRKTNIGSKPAIATAKTGYVVTVTKVNTGSNITVRKEDNSLITILLDGADAPEATQPFGYLAIKYLNSQIPSNKKVIIQETFINSQGDTVDENKYTHALVYAGSTCLNANIIKNGFAWFMPSYGIDAYKDEWNNLFMTAKDNKLGLWSDDYHMSPTEFRNLQKGKK